MHGRPRHGGSKMKSDRRHERDPRIPVPDARELRDDVAALLQAADELIAGADVSDSTWQELAGHFDPPALVEILFVVGQYTMLSMVANAAGIDAPEGGDRIP